MQPLPRSLDPLPDESLPGYLLRLAHRLDLAPSRLATRCGLATAHAYPAGTLLHLPDPVREAFATATRLTPTEAGALCLDSLADRYPLPEPEAASRRPARNTHPGRWMLAPATRYCPACLAGDGSQIQDAHGGCWRRTWHLPVAFACPHHHRLLGTYCPGCGQRTHHGRPGAPPRLLPAMGTPGLHPAQCRTALTPGAGRRAPACCGTRLDTPGDTPGTPEADQGLLDLQQHLLDLLHADPPPTATSAGRPTTAPGYFTDLRVLALFIGASWPATRHLAPSPALADAVEAHAARQQQQAADLAARSPASRRLRLLDTPPPEAAATAGLLSVAARLLALPSPGELREHLRPLLPANTRQARRTPSGQLMLRSPTCSAGLRQAGEPLLRSFTRTGGHPRGRREPTFRPTRLGPQHIPAFLPTDWYDRHLGHLGGIDTTLLRRTAAVRLVQMTSGGSLGQAAAFLGINPGGTQYTTANLVHSWARTQPDPHGFDTALHTLADELDSAGCALVDYHHRRTALRHWRLDEPTWHELAGRLPPTPGPVQPVLDDRKRQDASIFVWTLVTQGEHLFAPRPIEAAQPDHVQHAWAQRRNTTWYQLSRPDPLRHYADLRNHLIPYARQLAADIDRRTTHTDTIF